MKRTCFFILLSFVLSALSAQNAKFGGFYEHVINVKSYPDWGTGYLTITDNHSYIKDGTIHALTFSPTLTENDSFYYPVLGDIILEVNGISTKDMTPETFYAITDTASFFSLTWREISTNNIYTQQFKMLREINEDLKNYYHKNEFFADTRYYDHKEIRAKQFEKTNTYCNEIHDKSFDFSKVKTYDYLITGNDPLTDKTILEKMAFFRGALTRDTKNPDILFTIAKNADESIQSTYIPPTSRTINTGSTTTPKYNYITHTYSYTTKQNYQTINEGGYSETTKNADIYLELAALDAKKVNDKSINYPPIIWQYTVKRHVTNYNFDIHKELYAYASFSLFPIIDRYAWKETNLYKWQGLTLDSRNPSIVTKVVEGSPADKAGIKVGDKIIKCEASGRQKTIRKKYFYKLLWGDQKYYLTIKRDGKKMNVLLRPEKSTFFREFFIE